MTQNEAILVLAWSIELWRELIEDPGADGPSYGWTRDFLDELEANLEELLGDDSWRAGDATEPLLERINPDAVRGYEIWRQPTANCNSTRKSGDALIKYMRSISRR